MTTARRQREHTLNHFSPGPEYKSTLKTCTFRACKAYSLDRRGFLIVDVFVITRYKRPRTADGETAASRAAVASRQSRQDARARESGWWGFQLQELYPAITSPRRARRVRRQEPNFKTPSTVRICLPYQPTPPCYTASLTPPASRIRRSPRFARQAHSLSPSLGSQPSTPQARLIRLGVP